MSDIRLISYDELQSILHLEQDEDSYTDLVTISSSVTTAIESFLKRTLELNTYTDRCYVSNTAMIGLKALPVQSVSSVTSTINGVTSTITNYDITPYGIELSTPQTGGYVDVTYTGGYDEDDVPEDIARAALLQIAYEYQNHDHIGAESVTNEGGFVQRPALGLLKEVKRLLANHKHPLYL
jgi:hypothetical protein